MNSDDIKAAARLLGSIRTPKKAKSSAANGCKGGRPRTAENIAQGMQQETAQESAPVRGGQPALLELRKAGA